MTRTITRLEQADRSRIGAYLMSLSYPPQAYRDRCVAAGIREANAPSTAFSDNTIVARACASITGRRPLYSPPMDEATGLCVPYQLASHVAYSTEEVVQQLRNVPRVRNVEAIGSKVYLAMPVGSDPDECHYISVTCSARSTSSLGDDLRRCAGGAILHFLRDQAERLGIDVQEDRVIYRTSVSVEGVAIEKEEDVTDQEWVFKSLVGAENTYLGYAMYSVTNFLYFLINCQLVTPEFLEIDRDTQVYYGNDSRLDDPLFEGVIRYITHDCQAHTWNSIRSRSLEKCKERMMLTLPSRYATRTPIRMYNQAVLEATTAAVSQKLQAITESFGEQGAPVLPRMSKLEILGSSTDSLRKLLVQKESVAG